MPNAVRGVYLLETDARFPTLQGFVTMVENASDVRDGDPFPIEYLEPLRALWQDPAVQRGWERGNEAALPEKCVSGVLTPLSITRSRCLQFAIVRPFANAFAYYLASGLTRAVRQLLWFSRSAIRPTIHA